MNSIRLFLIAFVLSLVGVASAAGPTQEVSIWVSKNVAPSAKIRLNLNTKNVPVVHIAAYPVDGEKWLRRLDDVNHHRPAPTGKAKLEWDQTVASPNQKPNPNQADTYYSRQVNLPLLKPGVYLISVTAGQKEAWGVVNVTNLAVVAKRSPKRMLVWVTDAVKGNIVPDASIKLFDGKGEVLQTGKTGPDGAVVFPFKPGTEALVVQRGSDMAGIVSAIDDPNGKLVAHWQTDRPIYRPGQTVYFKTILRRTLDQAYKPVVGGSVKVQIRDPKDNPFDELTLTPNAMGSIDGKFEIPSEGQTGPYTLVLTTGGNGVAYQTVTVAAYRKPEFKVDAKPTEKRWLAGEPITFEVNAAYYFGAPVPQGQVQYTVRRRGMAFYWGGEDDGYFYSGDGNLYARDTYSQDQVIANDTVYTDNEGKVKITVPSDPNLGDQTYSIDVTVIDTSRRQVQASASVPVYSAKIRLGMSSEIYCASLGQLVPINLRAVDLDGKGTAAQVSVTVYKQVWNEKTGKWMEVALTDTKVKVPASGKATFSIPAKEAGNLIIRATAPDGTGRKARAEMELYVAGNFRPEKEKEEPKLDLRLDRKFYQPGQEVKAFVSTNRPKRPILVTMEGQDVWNYKVLLGGGKTDVSWTIPTTAAMSPNAFVTVSQWAENGRMSGVELVPIPDPTRKMKVEIVPDKASYRPGDKASYTVRTLDSQNKPIPAEVAVSVVDEAIYALGADTTQDLYQLYWGTRENHVVEAVSAPEEMSGGAYQRVNPVAQVRQRFEDTAYWNAMVQTDSTGTAHVEFEMPGNLTSWRTTARGVTADTKVGMARNNVLSNRPVMLRLATPRQVVQGDKVTLIGTVDNRSEEKRTFKVQLDVEGLKLEGGNTREVEIDAKKQAKVEWTLLASDLPESGDADLLGQIVDKNDARNPEYADALRVKLRVVPAGSPERVLVSGQVAQEATAKLDLPKDRIEPASVVKVEIRNGLGPVLASSADRVMRSGRYSSLNAADQLLVCALNKTGNTKETLEALAMLSRTQLSDGWGWWENAPADPLITAHVLFALAEARRSNITIYENLFTAAKEAAAQRYARTNLWEHRAVLAAALAFAVDRRSRDYLNETRSRGKNMSPYARLRMASAYAFLGENGPANELVEGVKGEMSNGPATSYVPVGEGIGWTANDIEATTEMLWVLAKLDRDSDTQGRLARWLADPSNPGCRWHTTQQDAAIVRALTLYTRSHPDARSLGDVDVVVGGQTIRAVPAKFGNLATATIPRSLLSDSTGIQIKRNGDGEAYYIVDATAYRPVFEESVKGVRVLRRYEVRNNAGVWVELNREVHPGEPVRCTVVTWGDDLSDGLRITEPIPAGFEFMESEYFQYGREEVRDGAILHYLLNNGAPQTFRYYIRAEAEGTLIALPATAEYLRRPDTRGQSAVERIEVKEIKQ